MLAWKKRDRLLGCARWMRMQPGWILEPMRSWCVLTEEMGLKLCVHLAVTPLTYKPSGSGWESKGQRPLRWKAPAYIGFRCSRNWSVKAFIATSLVHGLCAEYRD